MMLWVWWKCNNNVNKIKIKCKGIIDNIKFIKNFCVIFLYPLDLTESFINELKIVVSEAVTNAIVHGYEGVINDIDLKMEFSKDVIEIVIKDYGIGIDDINKAREPLFTTKPSEERSGLGFTIMEMFLDSLEVLSNKDEGTTLICRKYINGWFV